MRALRRIATPASVAAATFSLAQGGCSYPFDDYLPQQSDAGLTTNATATPQTPEDTGIDEGPRDSGVFETAPEDSSTEDTFEEPDTYVEPDTFVAEDTSVAEIAVDTAPPCKCVKYTGGKCREWSPPGCGD